MTRSAGLPVSPSSIAPYDARPFFEKALQFGLQHGVLDRQKIDAIRTEAPKGMVQIARYFGNEFLRPDLEKARTRIVNLVSLDLESSSGGDLRQAAETLRDHSLLSRSKAGSDMLRALLLLPESSSFDTHGDDEAGHAALTLRALADWSLKTLDEYQAELTRRLPVRYEKDAAIWLSERLGLGLADLEEAHTHAEAVIRTALLVLSLKRKRMPDWPMFEKMIATLRTKYGSVEGSGETAVSGKLKLVGETKGHIRARLPPFSIDVPTDLPGEFTAVVEVVRQSIVADLPKILDLRLSARALFAKQTDDRNPPLFGRYFWIEDIASEVDQHARSVSKAWDKVTAGNSDDGSLLTLFFCVATGAAPRTLLTEKAAVSLIRKIQKSGMVSGFDPDLARRYILDCAPAQYQHDYLQLWDAFVDEARQTLQSDSVSSVADAQALLRRECNVK